MNPKIYPLKEHGLSIDKIDPDALYVMEKLREAGFTAFLVGGGVRDLLLQKTPKDFDISTSAKPEEIKRLFRNSILIGRRFRLAHIRFGKKILEVSTFRSGDNETDSLIIRDNKWGSPEEDVLRRDFTINGLFYDSSNQTIIDYVEGYPDIEKKYLRTIGQPFLRFKQDPVRMIRLLKFKARFGLDICPEARMALLDCRWEIIKSSQARILEELLRMLESGSSRSFFQLMTENGILQLLLPSLASFLETKNGEEIFSYLNAIDLNFQDPEKIALDRSVLLACLIYPILQTHLDTLFIQRGKTPHLGEIHQEAHRTIDTIFKPFFLLSRRISTALITILTAQYRLTPFEKRRSHRLRIPNDPDFPLALQFLKIRSCLEPGFQKIWEEWQAQLSQVELPVHRPRRPRRRKRHGST
jgi:poly(A) polymerase